MKKFLALALVASLAGCASIDNIKQRWHAPKPAPVVQLAPPPVIVMPAPVPVPVAKPTRLQRLDAARARLKAKFDSRFHLHKKPVAPAK